jgi:hypothetical protein
VKESTSKQVSDGTCTNVNQEGSDNSDYCVDGEGLTTGGADGRIFFVDLWKAWLRVLSSLLRTKHYTSPSSIKLNATNTTVSKEEETALVCGSGSVVRGKALFVSFVAPRNGVGLLAAPLQHILKASRLLAAECYLALVEALVTCEVCLIFSHFTV